MAHVLAAGQGPSVASVAVSTGVLLVLGYAAGRAYAPVVDEPAGTLEQVEDARTAPHHIWRPVSS